MLGHDVVYNRLPYFFCDQYDLGMEYSGHAGPGITTRSSCAATSGPSSSRSGWRAVAGMNVNIWGVTDDIQRVIRSQTTLDPTGLADPDVALSEL
jgi:3-phenylpropionate/trans-cinnamate dioxygenase ferredoxin reductase component